MAQRFECKPNSSTIKKQKMLIEDSDSGPEHERRPRIMLILSTITPIPLEICANITHYVGVSEETVRFNMF